MTGLARACIFCGGRPLTSEHVYPRWIAPLINELDHPRSVTRVTHHYEHVHDVWETSEIDLRVRKVCRECNNGWMSNIEAAAKPVLTPLIRTSTHAALMPIHAIKLATWVSKTGLLASLAHADVTRFVPEKYFTELYLRRVPLRNSVVWIARYEGRYPLSASGVPIEPVNGFRITGNIGKLAYQLTACEDLARNVLVLPPPSLDEFIVPIFPAPDGLLRLPAVAMDDEQLRHLSQVPDHSWGVEGYGIPPTVPRRNG